MSLESTDLYLNRELSWLDFNARVLAEASDERVPLLERLKFIAIVSSNLDEFYMVRVAGLRRQVGARVAQVTPDGRTPAEQLTAIEERVKQLLDEQQRQLYDVILPGLEERGVRLIDMGELTAPEWAVVDDFFESHVFPVLTPLAVDPGHPFPYISNLSLSLAVEIRDPRHGANHFARVKVPRSIARWVPCGRRHGFVPVEQVIGSNLGALFPGMDVVGWWPFRITRYSDIDDNSVEEPEDLLATIEEQVFRRRFGEVVRIEVRSDMPEHIRSLILEELAGNQPPGCPPVAASDIHEMGPLLELGDMMALANLDIPDLRDPAFSPVVPEPLRDPMRSIFDVIRERDLLVHHPFHSFAATVERFLEEAAEDPDVLAIKMTLYRTSGDTDIVGALTEAARRGKQVAVLVELKARFEEANNIAWARTLESFGVHVAYGLPNLKTHAKLALVVRREADGIRRYVHIGTGNYNTRTARLYTDLGLFTCSPSIGADASEVFNMLTGFSRQHLYRKFLVAPANMRDRFIELIEREAEHARAGRPARIIAKMNALVDAGVIQSLYRASQSGVEIDLIVRGICCLRPGIPEISDRIRVRSLIGRFLEHSRVWRFANGGQEEYYLGSADWMPRNLNRRVEVVTPVEDLSLHPLLHSLMATCLADNRQAWELDATGTWTRRHPEGGEVAVHRAFLADPWGAAMPSLLPQADVSGRSMAQSSGD